MLKERYDKPVLIVETGYYNDRALEANQWLCDFLQLLMDAGASGLYYWEPELADDYDMGAWNPLTRKPSIALDAFLGLRHSEEWADGIKEVTVVGEDLQSSVGGDLQSPHIYTITGRRITNYHQLPKGIYIVQGRKVVVQ